MTNLVVSNINEPMYDRDPLKQSVSQLFDDLENFKTFCVENGYVFDEKQLYNISNFAYRQSQKSNPRNMWFEDSLRFSRQQWQTSKPA